MKEVFVSRTEDYYKQIKNVRDGMDNELTVSHILKAPNPFTKSGLPYGALVAGALRIQEGSSIVEIGPGLGDLAENICKGLTDFHYTFCDISYDFIRNLKTRFKGSRFSFEVGDFLAAKFREKFDVIICNEVLADLPTIVNMTLYGPKIRPGDEDAYYDAVSLAKFYGLSLPKISPFNYGAVKFLDKAKHMLNDGGKLFICEHSSKTPARIGVFGHSEYTIDFAILEKVAQKLGFRTQRGVMTDLLGINKKKAVLFYTHPELKMLYNFFKRRGIILEQKAYEIDEVVSLLENNGVSLRGRKDYAAFLEAQAKPLREITGQFNYLILEAKIE
jgi:hypothetical protein